MATKRKPSPAQIAARKAFAERARSGGFKRRKKVATSGAKVKRKMGAPSPAQLAAREKFVAMVRARAKQAKGNRVTTPERAKRLADELKAAKKKNPRRYALVPKGSGLATSHHASRRDALAAKKRAKKRGISGLRAVKTYKNLRRNVAGDSSVKSPTRTSSDVRSPTRTATSTEAQTSGNVTVTGGAGRGATTRVSIHTAAPRGTKAKVGKRANSRGFSSGAPAWTRNKKAKRNGVLLTNGRMRAACRELALRDNPGRVRFTEAELAKYAPKIKGLSLVGSSGASRTTTGRKKKAQFKRPAKRALARAFSGSGFLGLGRSRKTVRANKANPRRGTTLVRRKGKKEVSKFVGLSADRGGYGYTARRQSKRERRQVKIQGTKAFKKHGFAPRTKGYSSAPGRLAGPPLGRRLPNPSPASVFTEFRGKDVRSKSKATFHGNATGAVAQLGALRELKLIGKKLEFGGNAILCADGRKRLHIGGVRFKATGHEEDMGEVRSVTYRSDKPHIESGVLDYVHKFAEDGGKCPHLIVDPEGYPFLEGGSYKIDADGIIN